MQEDTFRALERGATLITPGQRLARVLRDAFHSRQRELGRSVWKRPDILPLDAFLDRAWREWLWRGAGDANLILLEPLQEQMLWEKVIRESAADSLLQIPETARSAMESWRLAQAYRLPVDGRYEASDDCAAFRGWSREFTKRLASNHWLERARLSDFVVARIAAGEISPPAQAYRAGFDLLTPQQSDCFAALGNPPEIEIAGFRPDPDRRRLPDATEEIRGAAGWARSLLERNPEAQIGIVVPNLHRLRRKVQRIFQQTLSPGREFDDPERSFHISLGPALGDYPLIHAALLILEFGLAGLALPRAGMLLRCPFLAGGGAEWSNRALLDKKLRRKGVWDVNVPSLRDAAGSCPRLQESLQRFDKLLEKLSGDRAPSEWAGHFSRLTEAMGWPGDRSLNRSEYQVMREWRALLSEFATLDRIAPLMTFDTAFWSLREAAGARVFQVENEGANVQIIGMLEASSMRFDHAWIMGLGDETLPAPAHPNPFLPLSLQQENGLPHASPERELMFAKDLIQRLSAIAPDLVLSHPEMDGDRALGPSPLVLGQWRSPSRDETPTEKWISAMRAGVQVEELADAQGPPLAVSTTTQPGGSYLFKDAAACPFRAFAQHRLGAKPLEESTLGLSYMDHGTGVHKALELIWDSLESHARLLEMDPGHLQRLVAQSVATAMNSLPRGLGRTIEQRRLEKLLMDFLDIEKTRDPFVVRKREQDRLVTIGGLQVRTRADRIDELPDGRQIILDYKTGQPKSNVWDTGRPDEPQLPLYCVTSDRPLAGAALVTIRTGELGFRGLTESGVNLRGMKDMRMSEPMPFARRVVVWKQVLERLAENFRAGRAEVDPKEGACDNCGLWALCRIWEYENDRG